MHVVDRIRYNRNRTKIRMFSSDNESIRTFDPFFHFVTGGAGVGKSMLIKALYEALCIEFDSDRDLEMNTPSVLLTAPTIIYLCPADSHIRTHIFFLKKKNTLAIIFIRSIELMQRRGSSKAYPSLFFLVAMFIIKTIGI